MPTGVSSLSHWSPNQCYLVSLFHVKDVSILSFGTFKPFIWLLKSSSLFQCRWWRTLPNPRKSSCPISWFLWGHLICLLDVSSFCHMSCVTSDPLHTNEGLGWPEHGLPFFLQSDPQVALSGTRLSSEPLINRSSRSFWVCAELSGHGSHASPASFPAGQILPLYSVCQHFPHCSSSNVFLVSALWLWGIIFVRDLLHGLTLRFTIGWTLAVESSYIPPISHLSCPFPLLGGVVISLYQASPGGSSSLWPRTLLPLSPGVSSSSTLGEWLQWESRRRVCELDSAL